MPVDRRRRAAFHEAGHVVVRWVLLRECHKVEISADGSGAAHWGGTATITERERCEAEIMIYMGGFMAEARAMNVTEQYARLTGGDGDTPRIVEMFDFAIEHGWATDHDSAADHYQDRTRALLAEHWSRVERIADALVSRASLNGDEVRALIEQL